MAIEAKAMVDYALKMLRPQSCEIERRNVINRAYYGAFLTARDQAGITSSAKSVHQAVVKHYSKIDSKLSNNLDVLKRDRQIADYQPRSNVTYKDAESSCKRAKRILTSLNNN